jgi:hypothetical protein
VELVAWYGIDADSDTESDLGIYRDVKSALHIDGWVGNIDAELESWELVNDSVVSLCYYCSRRFVTDFYRLPPHSSKNSFISICDLIPEKYIQRRFSQISSIEGSGA